MKKTLILFSSVLMFALMYSCTCECVGPNNGDANDKVCKEMYESVQGPNTWSLYESQALSVGWVCK